MHKLRTHETIKGFVELDIVQGTCNTLNTFLNCFSNKTKTPKNLFTIADSDSVQVDVYGKTTSYRISVQNNTADKTNSNTLAIWEIDSNGWAISDNYCVDNYVYPDGRRPVTYCSILDDQFPFALEPEKFEQRLNDVLDTLNAYNWRIIIGNKNVPEGIV